MKSILDPTFQYTPAVATNIMERFIANGLVPRKQPMSEIERLRRFKQNIESWAGYSDNTVYFGREIFEELLAEADGACND